MMKNRRIPFSPIFFSLLIAVGSILLAIWPILGKRAIIIGGVLIIGATLIEGLMRTKQEKSLRYKSHEILELHIETILRGLIDEIQRLASNSAPLRANVMFYSEKRRLYIKFDVNMEGCSDKTIQIEPNTGCAGKAYQLKEQIEGDLSKVAPEEWGLTKEQCAVTREIKSILSTPIFRGNQVMAVLNLDSSYPFENAGFNDKRIQDLCSKTANEIGELLKRLV